MKSKNLIKTTITIPLSILSGGVFLKFLVYFAMKRPGKVIENRKNLAVAAAVAAVETSIWSQRPPRESRESSGSAPPSEEENAYFHK